MNEAGDTRACSSLENLDAIARVEAVTALFPRYKATFAVLSCILLVSAVFSNAPPPETWALRALALLAVVTTTVVWRESRYSLYVMAVFLSVVTAGAATPFDWPDIHSPLGIAARIFVPVAFFGVPAAMFASNAKRFADVHAEGRAEERAQVREWTRQVNDPNPDSRTVEFTTKSFWTGNWNYRLLDTGTCWFVETRKSSSSGRLVSCRVVPHEEVRFLPQPERMDVQVASRRIRDVHFA